MLSCLLLVMAIDLTPQANINLSKLDIFSTEFDYTVGDGHVMAIILDGSEKVLLLVDAQGNLIARCGRNGQGPKEFQSPDSVWWDDHSKTFGVYDSGNRRISRWNNKGEFVSATPFTQRLKKPQQLDGNTLFFTRNELGIFGDAPAVMKVDLAQGEPGLFWEVGEDRYQLPSVKISGSTMVVSTIWDPLVIYALGKDFLALTYSSQGIVRVFNLKGEPLTQFSPKLKEYDVSDQDIDDQIERSFSIARSTLSAKRDQLYEGKSWPTIRSILVDGKDRIWVVGQPDRSQGHFPVQLYNAKGELITQITMKNEPTFILDNTIYSQSESSDQVFMEKATFSH